MRKTLLDLNAFAFRQHKVFSVNDHHIKLNCRGQHIVLIICVICLVNQEKGNTAHFIGFLEKSILCMHIATKHTYICAHIAFQWLVFIIFSFINFLQFKTSQSVYLSCKVLLTSALWLQKTIYAGLSMLVSTCTD